MFSTEEVQLIRHGARQRGNSDYLWFAVCVLAGPLFMALYGIVSRDYLAVAVAFFALLILVLWHISRQLKESVHYRSLCQKLVASDLLVADGTTSRAG
jgi:hypothetical protein